MKSKKEVLKHKSIRKNSKIFSNVKIIKRLRKSLDKTEIRLKKIKQELNDSIKTTIKSSKIKTKNPYVKKSKKTLTPKIKAPKIKSIKKPKKTRKIKPIISKSKKTTNTKYGNTKINKAEIKKAEINEPINKNQKIKSAKIDINKAELSFNNSEIKNQVFTYGGPKGPQKLKTEESYMKVSKKYQTWKDRKSINRYCKLR